MADHATQWPQLITSKAMPEKIAGIERVHITLPKDIIDALKELAQQEDRSFSAEAARQLRKALKMPAPKGQR
jgi:tartrate dehydratase alpha subunit/fumarate hydratase class I-like protein